MKYKSITGAILGREILIEELESEVSGKKYITIIGYTKKSLWNRIRLWLSKKIRPEITGIIPVNAVSEDEARAGLINPPGSQVKPIEEYEQIFQDTPQETQGLLTQEDTC